MLFECTKCTELNDDNRRFCFNCGELLGCPQCGFINDYIVESEQTHDFFCGGCGSKLDFSNTVLDAHAPMENFAAEQTLIPSGQSNGKMELSTLTILGFDLGELTMDVDTESTVKDTISLGGPKHLQQDDLDELFDV